MPDKHHLRKIAYVRFKNRSYRLCLRKSVKINRIRKICKNAIEASEFHKIKQKRQKRIYEYLLKTGRDEFKRVFPNSRLKCEIYCADKDIDIKLSLFDLQAISGGESRKLPYVHQKINGILLPLTFKITENSIEKMMVYLRVICFSLRGESYPLYKKPDKIVKHKINYWSENFIGKPFIDCSQSSLIIADCKSGFLAKNENSYLIKIKCTYQRTFKDEKFLLKKCKFYLFLK